MRIKVYALDARTGHSKWHFGHQQDYVELLAGAALRHVSATRNLVFVTTSSGELYVLSARNGRVLFIDQTPDLNEVFDLGLGKPHHASMNAGTIIANGMIFTAYGAQNNPSGGIVAYEVNHRPSADNDSVIVSPLETTVIDALANDSDPDGDMLRFARVAGRVINTDDGMPDEIRLAYGTLVVVNPGDDPAQPESAYLEFTPSRRLHGHRDISYLVEDVAPNRVVNGVELDEPNPTHQPRFAWARIYLRGGHH
jgi:outer membrane protein assembly factor BamB